MSSKLKLSPLRANIHEYLTELFKRNSLERFLQLRFANLLSIALTFGTSAIVDYRHKQKDKRAITMMVMFDMYHSLESVILADSLIYQSMLYQRQVLADTALFAEIKPRIIDLLPKPKYTESTENIYSSNIETINTVDDIRFTELVTEFYLFRSAFRRNVCDDMLEEVTGSRSVVALQSYLGDAYTVSDFLRIDYCKYALCCTDLLAGMKLHYDECKRILHVTDEDICEVRQHIERQMDGRNAEVALQKAKKENIIHLQHDIDMAKQEK